MGGDICLRYRQNICPWGIINDADRPIALAEVPEMDRFQTENGKAGFICAASKPLKTPSAAFQPLMTR